MTPLPEVVIQQPGWMLTTLDHFLHGKNNALSLLEWIHILVTDLHFLHIMLLPKPQFMNLQNALSIIILFHKVLLLTKVLNSQPEKSDSGPTVIESTGFTMFPTILKQLV